MVFISSKLLLERLGGSAALDFIRSASMASIEMWAVHEVQMFLVLCLFLEDLNCLSVSTDSQPASCDQKEHES